MWICALISGCLWSEKCPDAQCRVTLFFSRWAVTARQCGALCTNRAQGTRAGRSWGWSTTTRSTSSLSLSFFLALSLLTLFNTFGIWIYDYDRMTPITSTFLIYICCHVTDLGIVDHLYQLTDWLRPRPCHGWGNFIFITSRARLGRRKMTGTLGHWQLYLPWRKEIRWVGIKILNQQEQSGHVTFPYSGLGGVERIWGLFPVQQPLQTDIILRSPPHTTIIR